MKAKFIITRNAHIIERNIANYSTALRIIKNKLKEKDDTNKYAILSEDRVHGRGLVAIVKKYGSKIIESKVF